MPAAGSPAKCQCCCVDRLCSRGENRGGPPPQGMEQPGRYLPGCFFAAARKKPPLMLSGGQTVKGPRRVCACGRKESPIIFFGDMCGEENTSRPANVRAGRLRRTARALQSGRKPLCQKVLLFDSLNGGGGGYSVLGAEMRVNAERKMTEFFVQKDGAQSRRIC